ncbi:MAG: hypothetical protein WCK33_03350 [Phycisphaerae bacterium]|jgi:hypothetical protein
MKISTSIVLASLATACAAGMANADTVRFTDATGKFNGTTGGAFVAQRVGGNVGLTGGLGLTGNNFYTFCVERNASIQLNGTTTYFGQISMSSSQGANSNVTTGTTRLSNITARLYREFRSNGTFGRVGSFVNGYTTAAQTDAIQNAIWAAQGQISTTSLTGDSLALYNWARLNSSAGLKGVRVLRLWTTNTNGVYSGASQDQLTMVPLPPAAWAGLGTLACLVGASHLRRRRLAAA